MRARNSRKPLLTKPRHDYAFFTDRDLGRRVPDALEAAGFRVERHAHHFAPNALDPEWIPIVGQHPDWIAITHDARQRYNPEDRDAIMRSGVVQFIHVGHMPHSDLAASFVLQAERIIRFRERHMAPFIAKVYRPVQKTPYRLMPGEIQMALTVDQWQRGQRDLDD